MISNKVNILSVLRHIQTGVQILIGEIRIIHVQQVDEFDMGCISDLVDDTLE